MKKLLVLLTILVMTLTTPLYASAQSDIGRMANAASALLFETENMTVKGNAQFRMDGTLFKRLDLLYIQNIRDHRQQIELYTPRADGSEKKGGYSVTLIGTDLTVEESANGMIPVTTKHYDDHGDIIPAVRRTAYLDSLADLVCAVMNGIETALPSGSVLVNDMEDGGTGIRVTLKKGESPAVLDSLLTLMAQYAVRRYKKVDPDDLVTRTTSPYNGTDILYEDYDGLVETLYRQRYGEKPGSAFWDAAWMNVTGDLQTEDSEAARYSQIMAELEALTAEARKNNPSGVISVTADGQVNGWPTEDAYLIATGKQSVLYDDFDAVFIGHWKEKTGNDLTADELNAMREWYGAEGYSEYLSMMEEMEDFYLSMAGADPEASAIRVLADGSTVPVHDIRAYDRARALYMYSTVTEGITYMMTGLKLDEIDLYMETDREGRLTKVSADAVLTMEDRMNGEHELAVEMDVSVGEFGTSVVE